MAPNDGVYGTAGSGCRPGTSGTLPDGVWLVAVTAFGPTGLDVGAFPNLKLPLLDA